MTEIEYLTKYQNPSKMKESLLKLEKGIPVQYIVGNVEFYNCFIKINKNVLIPRFETELLVEKSIKIIKEYLNLNIKILEIGTGSGCISISLKRSCPDFQITAVDISRKALKVAKKNALINNTKIIFKKSDILSNVKSNYDCIISNPPYISTSEKIMDIVFNNEPKNALFAPNNGLYFYEEIIKNSLKILNKKNIIAFEIGFNQGTEIKKIAKKYYQHAIIIIEKDYSKKDRFVFIINN